MTMTSNRSQVVFFPDALQALFQILGVILVGDEDAHLRLPHNVPPDPIGAGVQAILYGTGAAGALQMVGQRLLCRFGNVGLGIGAAGGRAFVHPPVVEHLRHMGRAAHLLNEPEEEVVVLTAITFGAFPAHLLEQLPPEHGQMADVVAAEQIIRGIIGLEVGHQRLFDLFW